MIDGSKKPMSNRAKRKIIIIIIIVTVETLSNVSLDLSTIYFSGC